MPCASTGISLLVLGARACSWLPSKRRLRRAVDVGVDQPDLLAHPRQRDGEVGGDGRLADPALAAADGDQGARGLRGGHRDPRFADAGNRQRRVAQLALERLALLLRQAGRVGDDRRDAARQLARADPLVVRQVGQRIHRDGPWPAHRKRAGACHCFSCGALPILGRDEHFSGVGRAAPAACSPTPRDRGARASPATTRRRTTARAPGRGASRRAGSGGRRSARARNVSSLDELFRRSRARFGGGGGGFPGRPDRSLIVWAVLGFILVWLVFTSFHSISPGQRGVVTRFGRYSCDARPGRQLDLALADRPGEEDRRREYPHASTSAPTTPTI